MTNPLLEDWTSPFGMPPFDRIEVTQYRPAIDRGLEEARARITEIAGDARAATFENTIEALELSDKLLNRVAAVFFNIAGTNSTPEIESLQRELSPLFAAHHAETMMNDALFQRIEALVDNVDALDLNDEQKRVLELYHTMFVRAGARLSPADKTRLKAIMGRLASLGTAFTQNVLADERDWFMALDSAALEGLPKFLVDAMAMAAQERDRDGHVLTLSRSLIVPFLQFSPRRDLRQSAFEAWTSRGANGGKTDNRALLAETLRLREERARLLGYDSFADYKLDKEMAKTPDAVRELLMAVWVPARQQALVDQDKLTEMMRADGIDGPLAPWDWRFYAERRRSAEFDLDEAELKPYLQLDRMRDAAFSCATRLFGLEFEQIDVPLPHPDAVAFEVRRDGAHVGVFIGDYFNRSSKRSGAWCSRFRDQHRLEGDVSPIVVNVCNFAKAPDGEPCLLTFDDARTLFHEFGHALHGLLSNVTYPFISGTSVARDFVELPSQLYEHWLSVPEVLREYAIHAETGEPMPLSLVDRVLAAENFDQGFATVEYTSSALVDLDFHSGPAPADPMQSQAETLDRLGMPTAIRMRHAAPHFAHVFSGDGYSSGYYSYMWSEVMDADAFAAFTETGDPFNPDVAALLAKHIYSAGGSRHEAELYTAFRGKLPDVSALLKQRGLDAVA